MIEILGKCFRITTFTKISITLTVRISEVFVPTLHLRSTNLLSWLEWYQNHSQVQIWNFVFCKYQQNLNYSEKKKKSISSQLLTYILLTEKYLSHIFVIFISVKIILIIFIEFYPDYWAGNTPLSNEKLK